MGYPASPPAAGAWGSSIELVRRRRIMVAVWAYAYEVLHESIVSDSEYDSTCRNVAMDINCDTGNSRMDAWFRHNFDPSTGMWVHNHPGKKRLAQIAEGLISGKPIQIRSRPTEAISGMFVE